MTETWCNPSITNTLLNIPGYFIDPALRIDRSDTNGGRGGGILIYVRNGLTILSHNQPNSTFNQYCYLTVKSADSEINLLCIYRSPNSLDINNEKLCELLKLIKPNTVIIGDINYPNINWKNLTSDQKSASFVEAAQDMLLEQVIEFPTHIKGNILDLILTNIPEKLINVEEIGRLGKSDHCLIYFELLFKCNETHNHETYFKWNMGDYNAINRNLAQVDWNIEFDGCDTYESWNIFKDKLNTLVNTFIPKQTKKSNSKPRWITRTILRNINKKRRLWKSYKMHRDNETYIEYKKCEKQVQNSIRNAKRNLEKKLANNSRNSRAFNSYVKSRSKDKSGVGPLINDQGQVISESMDMAEILNKSFSTVYTKEDTQNIPIMNKLPCTSTLENVTFTPELIKAKIKKMKPSPTPGVDGFTVPLLQSVCDQISKPLSLIYNKSIQENKVPTDWREANVTPIFKKGARGKPSNYRPISLTSVPCKIMESIIKDHIVDHLTENKLINPSQHGFMNNKSCQTNLLEYLETITEALDSGQIVDIVYLDFAKAFDKVPKKRLVTKFRAHSIDGNLLNWIESWLSDRRQRVVLNGKYSSWMEVESGVPQGSILGPVGFTIYINDLDDPIQNLVTLIKKFADDTKTAKIILDDQCILDMQESLNKLHKWAEIWGMVFNVDKCKVMHIGKNNSKHNYTMNGQILQKTSEEKDVGILISDTMKPSQQCSAAANKANQVLGQICRAFHFRDRNIFLKLYKQYVRVHMEFAVSSWRPWTQQDKDKLENVQRKAVRIISGLHGSTYEEKLEELGLQSLEARRERSDMIQTYKIVHGLDDVDKSLWFQHVAETSERLTRQSADILNLKPKNSKLELRRNCFSSRVVNSWNKLPQDVKSAKNVIVFKNKYDQYIRSTMITGIYSQT